MADLNSSLSTFRDRNLFGKEINNSLSKLNTSICNLISKENIEITRLYNTNEQFIVTDTNTLTLSGDTYHFISYEILSGTANITIGGILINSVLQGYSKEFKATTLLTNSIIFTGLSSGTKIGITTLK